MRSLMIGLILCVSASFAAAQSQHLTQTSTTQVVAERGNNVCFFNAIGEETLSILCRVGQTFKFNETDSLFIGDCKTGNFAGTNIQWQLCRTGNFLFSWDIFAGTLHLSGTI